MIEKNRVLADQISVNRVDIEQQSVLLNELKLRVADISGRLSELKSFGSAALRRLGPSDLELSNLTTKLNGVQADLPAVKAELSLKLMSATQELAALQSQVDLCIKRAGYKYNKHI